MYASMRSSDNLTFSVDFERLQEWYKKSTDIFRDYPIMHVISKKKLREFWAIHPEAKSPLENWFRVAKRSDWKTFADLRATFPTADKVDKYIVFNLGGNNYRLISEINFERGRVFLRRMLTHADHSRGAWRKN